MDIWYKFHYNEQEQYSKRERSADVRAVRATVTLYGVLIGLTATGRVTADCDLHWSGRNAGVLATNPVSQHCARSMRRNTTNTRWDGILTNQSKASKWAICKQSVKPILLINYTTNLTPKWIPAVYWRRLPLYVEKQGESPMLRPEINWTQLNAL
jgi:hypothetical protein